MAEGLAREFCESSEAEGLMPAWAVRAMLGWSYHGGMLCGHVKRVCYKVVL